MRPRKVNFFETIPRPVTVTHCVSWQTRQRRKLIVTRQQKPKYIPMVVESIVLSDLVRWLKHSCLLCYHTKIDKAARRYATHNDLTLFVAEFHQATQGTVDIKEIGKELLQLCKQSDSYFAAPRRQPNTCRRVG